MTTGPQPKTEPSLSLPTVTLLATVLMAAGATALAWWAAVASGVAAALGVPGRGPAEVAAGLAGVALVTVIALLAVVIMTPWKTREVSSWMNFWLGGTVLRLLVTPPAAFVLYSATSHSAAALALSVAAAYIATLFSEAIVLSVYLKRTLHPGS